LVSFVMGDFAVESRITADFYFSDELR
jgi:hypothetical protein